MLALDSNWPSPTSRCSVLGSAARVCSLSDVPSRALDRSIKRLRLSR